MEDCSHGQPERSLGSLRSLSDSSGSAAAMTPPELLRPLPKLRLLLSVAAALLMTSLPVSALEPETCFSRQHQSATVNVRVAVSRATMVMDARVVRTERDCVLACCSEEVKPGARCNMAVFNSNKQAREDNCILFHCQSEQDCPLMKAQDGINAYDIYKGLSHPPTLRPVTMTTSTVTTTTPASTTLATITATTTPTTTTTMAPTTTTQAPPTTTEPSPIIIIATMPAVTSPPTTVATTTTAALSSTLITRKPNKTSKKQNKITKKGKPHPADAVTTARPAPGFTTSLPVVTVIREHRTTDTPKPHTTTTTTAAPTTTTTTPTTTTTTPTSTITPTTTTTTTTPTSTTTPTTTTTTITPSSTTTPTSTTTTTTTPTSTTTPATTTTTTPTSTTTPTTTTTTTPTPTPTSTTTPTTTTTTTTTPTSTTTTTTTTTSPPTTTTTTEPSTTMTAPATSLIIVPKDAVQPGHTLQNSNAGQGKALAAQGALKSGVVAFMVLGLAVLMLALAVGGRKAMESFDRRHYTRLELNDLHYEV